MNKEEAIKQSDRLIELFEGSANIIKKAKPIKKNKELRQLMIDKFKEKEINFNVDSLNASKYIDDSFDIIIKCIEEVIEENYDYSWGECENEQNHE